MKICELMKRCAHELSNSELWGELHSRTKRTIVKNLLKAFCVSGGRWADFPHYADDWVQDVFTQLVQDDGHVIRSFRGSTEGSAHAFLASIAVTTVKIQFRFQRSFRRRAQHLTLDEFDELIVRPTGMDHRVSALLDLIDLERMLKSDLESKNPERDLLIFNLHFVEGLTAREIAAMPDLNLTISGLEKVVARLRSRVNRLQGVTPRKKAS